MTQTKLQLPNNLQLPPWPTSKPGPKTKEPPPGQKPMPGRTDQMVEVVGFLLDRPREVLPLLVCPGDVLLPEAAG